MGLENKKQSGTKRMCEDLYVENYRIPEREIKDLNK